MALQDIKLREIMDFLGDKSGEVSGNILAIAGIETGEIQTKIVSLIILSIFLLVTIKFLNFFSKPIKIIIMTSTLVLIISVTITLL